MNLDVAGPPPGELYHVGIVVADLDAAMAEYGSVFGVEWTGRLGADQPIRFPDRTATITFAAVYSRQGPCRLELVQEIPGTLWTCGRGLHHLGFWCDDVAAAGARLEKAGYAPVAAQDPGDGSPPMFAYYAGPDGIYVELVSAPMLRESLEAVFAGGQLGG
jgi:catechol 2,3-dioxygenase-like lactoylglutathione lyase family enzyme